MFVDIKTFAVFFVCSFFFLDNYTLIMSHKIPKKALSRINAGGHFFLNLFILFVGVEKA